MPEAEETAEPADVSVAEIASMVPQTGLVAVIPGPEPEESEPPADEAQPEPELDPEAEPEAEPVAELPAPVPAPRPEPRRHEPRRPAPRPQPQQPKPRREESPKETGAFGRCLECNVPLEALSREAARPLVPFFIYQIHYEFRRCPKCRKVFWPGSHVADMEKRTRPAPPPRHQGPRRRRPDSRRHGPSQ